MRENRSSGSEGGETGKLVFPTPITRRPQFNQASRAPATISETGLRGSALLPGSSRRLPYRCATRYWYSGYHMFLATTSSTSSSGMILPRPRSRASRTTAAATLRLIWRRSF